MAPPVWAKLSKVTGDPIYRDWMFHEYKAATEHLFDVDESLFYRDSRFFEQRDHGQKIFWSRGNGWVFAGLPLIIESLENGEQKNFFVALFKKMADRIVTLQNGDGLWPMSLLLEDVYTTPETSGSAFFVYGLAWGVNSGLLEGERFNAAILRGWNSLTGYVDEDGMLGYVQPIGAAPGEAWPDRTEVYGIGAFLLAGTEMVQLVGNN
jgi:rhamnogalacturonyl hydrolase YesR